MNNPENLDELAFERFQNRLQSRRILSASQFLCFRDEDKTFKQHKRWVRRIKEANLSPIKPASEVTPKFEDV